MELTTDARVTMEGKPFVAILLNGEQIGQLDPADTIRLGLRTIQSGIEAERDAGFLSFLFALDDTREGLEAAAGMLRGLREYREQFDVTNPLFAVDPRKDGIE